MAEDFLAYLQKQAAKPSLIGPGTPGYASARLGRFTSGPEEVTTAPYEVPEDDGGFLSGIPGVPEEGLGWGLLDILSRGNYAASNMFQEGIRDVRAGDPNLQSGEELGLGNTIKAALAGLDEPGQAWQGLSGQQKVTGASVVEDALGESADEKGGFGKGAAALAIDIFGDPTSYIGAGLVKSLARGATAPFKSAESVATSLVDDAAETIVEAAPANLAGAVAKSPKRGLTSELTGTAPLLKTPKSSPNPFSTKSPEIIKSTSGLIKSYPAPRDSSSVCPLLNSALGALLIMLVGINSFFSIRVCVFLGAYDSQLRTLRNGISNVSL